MVSVTEEMRVRPARSSDTPAMLRITRDVWDGSDYVPFVWHDWLEDAHGIVQVAVRGETVLGFQHIALQPDGSAWLEGIRVASDLHGGGIGGVLLAAGVGWAREAGCPAARLATSSGNPASNRIAERGGFTSSGNFSRAEAAPLAGYSGPVRTAQPYEADEIWAVLEVSGLALYTEGWTAYRLSAQRLRLLLAMQSVAVCGRPEDGVLIATATARRPALRLGLLTGSREAMTEMGRWLRGRADDIGFSGVRGPVQLDEAGVEALAHAGFDIDHKWYMRLWELNLT